MGCDRRSVISSSNWAVIAAGRHRSGVEHLQRWVELEGGDRSPHERLELGPVRLRHAEHLTDHRDRELQGQLGDHVDHAVAAVEQLVGQPHDVGPELLDGPRRERLRHQLAQPRVVRRVEAEHRLRPLAEVLEPLEPLLFGEAVLLPHRPRLALAEPRVSQHRLAVVVSTDHHDPESAPEDRGVLANGRVARIRIGLALGREQDLGQRRIQVDDRRVRHEPP